MNKRNNKIKQSIELEKYKEIYNLSKEVFDKELRRSEIIDEKASKYLTTLTLLLGIFAFFAERLINSNLSPYQCLDLIQIIICVILLFLIFATFIFVFLALKIRSLTMIDLDTDTFLKHPTLDDLYYKMSKKIENIFRDNRDRINSKARKLQTGYILTLIIVILLVTLAILFIFRSLKLQNNNNNKASYSIFNKFKNVKYPEFQLLEKLPIEETSENKLNPNITTPLFNFSADDSNLLNQN